LCKADHGHLRNIQPANDCSLHGLRAYTRAKADAAITFNHTLGRHLFVKEVRRCLYAPDTVNLDSLDAWTFRSLKYTCASAVNRELELDEVLN